MSHRDVTRSLEELLIINMLFIFLASCHLIFFSFIWNRRHQLWRLADTLIKELWLWVGCFYLLPHSPFTEYLRCTLELRFTFYFLLEKIHKLAQDRNLALTPSYYIFWFYNFMWSFSIGSKLLVKFPILLFSWTYSSGFKKYISHSCQITSVSGSPGALFSLSMSFSSQIFSYLVLPSIPLWHTRQYAWKNVEII